MVATALDAREAVLDGTIVEAVRDVDTSFISLMLPFVDIFISSSFSVVFIVMTALAARSAAAEVIIAIMALSSDWQI